MILQVDNKIHLKTVMSIECGKKSKFLGGNNRDSQKRGQRMLNDQNMTIPNMTMDCRRKSKRWREASEPVLIKKNQTFESNNENDNASNYCDEGSRNDRQNSDVIVNERFWTGFFG
ncbi:uncharacterized protein LOC112193798 isoform X1 [Rosa chinensis]|uniref:uncharacterized protein LOC112193798 isoform X1 n=1 Tax=Rosa chinensis TaxID=74649 RepID=UPI000D092539|nr:uncharacterized protein LOC112193798 isoform X1 [Rosa chinensis]